MRLWSLHPKYLDARGLVALWREALLAQAVLAGQTRGYTRHPQLVRFRNAPAPAESIAAYLQTIHDEASRRGYHFDETKIAPFGSVEPVSVSQGQLEYEWSHLKKKLRLRDPSRLAGFEQIVCPEPNPLFRIVPGPAEEWEVIRHNKVLPRKRLKV